MFIEFENIGVTIPELTPAGDWVVAVTSSPIIFISASSIISSSGFLIKYSNATTPTPIPTYIIVFLSIFFVFIFIF